MTRIWTPNELDHNNLNTVAVDSPAEFYPAAVVVEVLRNGRFKAEVAGVLRSFDLRTCKVFSL